MYIGSWRRGYIEGSKSIYRGVDAVGSIWPSNDWKTRRKSTNIKDHPYADGCKRIAASLFLEFLDRNNFLYKNGEKRISDGALVAITLMIAESDPVEKDIMVNLVINLLTL